MIDHNAPLTPPSPLVPQCSVEEFNSLQNPMAPVTRRRDNGPEPSIDLPEAERKTSATSRQTSLTVDQQFESSGFKPKVKKYFVRKSNPTVEKVG